MTEHFFVVGAQRSGTTYLYRLLEDHPAVAMARPLRPEPKVFLTGESARRTSDWYEERFFGHATADQVRGEKSAGYLEAESAARAIAEWYPKARILAILREPVGRAISNYRFSVENAVETLPIAEAFAADPDTRVGRDGPWFVVGDRRMASNPFAYLSRGRYADHLAVYADVFGRERIHVTLYEDLVGSVGAIRRIYAFIGVDESHEPQAMSQVTNPSRAPRVTIDAATRRRLREYYEESNSRLARDFALDLGPWSARPD